MVGGVLGRDLDILAIYLYSRLDANPMSSRIATSPSFRRFLYDVPFVWGVFKSNFHHGVEV